MESRPSDSTPREKGTGTHPQVLLVDDDVELCAMLGEYLGREGYAITAVHDGESGIARSRSDQFDIVVMDITMPRLDGFETLRRIRTFSAIPVLMLTARGDDVDRIVGLELGADDYLAKPFNPRELSARIKAILRRAQPPAETPDDRPRRMVRGDLVLDPSARVLSRGGEPLPLTGTEYAVAEILVRAVGSVVSKEALSEQALGRRLLPFDRSIDTHVSNLRRKLGPAPNGSQRIKTIRGRGYLFVPP